MTINVVCSQNCKLHNPPYEILSGKIYKYFECPDRIDIIKQALENFEENNPRQTFIWHETEEIDVKQNILTVHAEDYVDYIEGAYVAWVAADRDPTAVFPDLAPHFAPTNHQLFNPKTLPPVAKAGLYCFDLSAPITEHTHAAARAAVQTVITASKILLQSHVVSPERQCCFALIRPPGHHSGPSVCGGYCFFNNAAIATKYIQSDPTAICGQTSSGVVKVAILDIDYHHGNGTQHIFYEDPSVLYVSIHAENDYPYFTGTVSETGSGAGVGYNHNIPLPMGATGDAEYFTALQVALSHINNFKPSYLVVSLGVDTFKDDPICNFKLTTPFYSRVGEAIASANLPTLFVMEGGYCLEALGQNVLGVLTGFNSVPFA